MRARGMPAIVILAIGVMAAPAAAAVEPQPLVWRVEPREARASVSHAVSDRVDLFLGLRPPKQRRLGERVDQRTETSAGVSRPLKAVKLGVLIRW